MIVSPASASELEAFFESQGKLQYCWCARWRVSSSDFGRLGKEGRRDELLGRAHEGHPTGLLARHEGRVVGWVSVAPRDAFAGSLRSRVLARPDEEGVWSVTCVFIASSSRRQGLPAVLLRAAGEHGVRSGARAVEGFAASGDSYRYMGTEAQFLAAGYRPAGVAPGGRSVMRYRA